MHLPARFQSSDLLLFAFFSFLFAVIVSHA
jgi:hypothetical protein